MYARINAPFPSSNRCRTEAVGREHAVVAVRFTLGLGTRAASRAMNSSGSKMMCVVPSWYGVLIWVARSASLHPAMPPGAPRATAGPPIGFPSTTPWPLVGWKCARRGVRNGWSIPIADTRTAGYWRRSSTPLPITRSPRSSAGPPDDRSARRFSQGGDAGRSHGESARDPNRQPVFDGRSIRIRQGRRARRERARHVLHRGAK